MLNTFVSRCMMRSIRRRAMRFLLFVAICLVPALSFARSDVPELPAERAVAEIAAGELPREARQTLALIRHGGPFPYERDGVVFRNFEQRLPLRARGYYREYTVPTPGTKHRGARRIVTGLNGEWYYTDDHYQSFKRIRP